MKKSISMLMDGELNNEDAEILLGKIKRDPEVKQEWSNYHLIGDIMRQPDYISTNISTTLLRRLHAEPTVLAPHGKRSSNVDFIAMSAVASIMAMAFLTWVSVSIDAEPADQLVRQSVRVAVTNSISNNDDMNDYLLAHQEFSPGSDVKGAASYIQTVSMKSIAVRK